MNHPPGHHEPDIADPSGPRSDGADLHMDLTTAGRMLWRRRVPIAGVALAACVIAGGLSLMGPRLYEATVMLAATPPKIGDDRDRVAASVAGSLISQVQVIANFKPLIESGTTAVNVVNDLALDKRGERVSPDELLRSMVTVEEMHGTNLIRISARAADPVLAAKIADRMAFHSVRAVDRINAEEMAAAQAFIKEQLDQLKARVENAETKLLVLKERPHPGLPEKVEMARAEMERAAAEKAYVDVATRHEITRLQVAARSPQLRVVDPVSGSWPLPRHVIRNVAVGAILAVFVSAVVFLLLDLTRAQARRQAVARPAGVA